jgi:hypothetical protein
MTQTNQQKDLAALENRVKFLEGELIKHIKKEVNLLRETKPEGYEDLLMDALNALTDYVEETYDELNVEEEEEEEEEEKPPKCDDCDNIASMNEYYLNGDYKVKYWTLCKECFKKDQEEEEEEEECAH